MSMTAYGATQAREHARIPLIEALQTSYARREFFSPWTRCGHKPPRAFLAFGAVRRADSDGSTSPERRSRRLRIRCSDRPITGRPGSICCRGPGHRMRATPTPARGRSCHHSNCRHNSLTISLPFIPASWWPGRSHMNSYSPGLVMKARGINPEDAELLVTIRKRVGACMWKLKQAGHVREVPTAGELKAWVMACQQARPEGHEIL